MSRRAAIRGRWRALHLGLSTVLGLRRRGFFIPYRHADSVTPPDGYPALEPAFRAAEPRMTGLLEEMRALLPALKTIGEDAPPQPRWNQAWFPRLDAAAAYAMLRRARPALVVEVGAGHSTRFFARAVADGGLATRIVAVDPAPRADLAGLASVELRRQVVQDADPALFAALGPGDLLSIDSSHILMPGTDVDLLLNDVLPRLAAGVLVHIHDIFLPDAYPAAWAWRGYNEQQALAPLIAGGGYAVEWSSRYAVARGIVAVDDPLLQALPLHPSAVETSVWLRKGGSAGEAADEAAGL